MESKKLVALLKIEVEKLLIYNNIIKEIKQKFNGDAYLYYDEIDRELSIALSDIDLYWNDEFRKYISIVLDSFGSDTITIINLPEKFIHSSKIT